MKNITTILFLILCSFTYGQTYYISPTGNDAANGSQATPWKTLSKATSTVTTGTIRVTAGTYTEGACFLKSGVNIEGEGVDISIIKSSVTGQWNTFMELQSPQNTNGNQTISGVTINGQTSAAGSGGTWVGLWITGRSNVTISNCKIINFYASAAIFDGFDATSPLSDPGVTATGNKFTNNTLSNCSGVLPENGYNGTGSVMMGGQTGMVIQYNTITNTSRAALKNGWPIKYWDNGYLKGCKILNNTLTKAPYKATYWGQGGDWDFCIELFNIQGLEIANNEIQGSIDLNYNYKGSYPYSVWIHDNTLNHAVPNYTSSESGVILEFKTESALIENNVFNNKFVGVSYNTRGPNNHGDYTYPCGTGGCSAITDNIIRNNLFTNLYASFGVTGGVIVQSEGTNDPYVDGLQIYNNTFVAKATGGSYTGLDFTSQGGGNVKNVSIHHNIFQGFGSSIVGQAAATQSNISIATNNYFQGNAPTWSGNGVTISGNLNLNPNFNASWNTTNATLIAAGIGWNGVVTPPTPCSSYTYSAWSTCINGTQTRTVTSSLPAGCSGGVAPILTQSCVVIPVLCTSYIYSAWSTCVNNVQTRTVTGYLPSGCSGTISTPPVLTQACISPIPGDTILTSVILRLQTGTSNALPLRNLTYIVKRANGKYYTNTGAEVDVIMYKNDLTGRWAIPQ